MTLNWAAPPVLGGVNLPFPDPTGISAPVRPRTALAFDGAAPVFPGARADAFEAEFAGGAFKLSYRNRIIERVVQPAQMGGPRKYLQVGADEAQIVAFARTKHHAVLAQPNWLTIAVNGCVVHGEE